MLKYIWKANIYRKRTYIELEYIWNEDIYKVETYPDKEKIGKKHI